MKKLFTMMLVFTVMITAARAQKLQPSMVPTVVKDAFAKHYAMAKKVSWEKEKEGYEVDFKWNGKDASVLYSAKGIMLESEIDIKISELPDLIKMKLKGMKVTDVTKITNTSGEVLYEIEVNGKDQWFDANGNVVKKRPTVN